VIIAMIYVRKRAADDFASEISILKLRTATVYDLKALVGYSTITLFLRQKLAAFHSLLALQFLLFPMATVGLTQDQIFPSFFSSL
jgi:hypothetical protein